jgi:hypothetical protein
VCSTNRAADRSPLSGRGRCSVSFVGGDRRVRVRGTDGEFFVHQNNNRVYQYVP